MWFDIAFYPFLVGPRTPPETQLCPLQHAGFPFCSSCSLCGAGCASLAGPVGVTAESWEVPSPVWWDRSQFPFPGFHTNNEWRSGPKVPLLWSIWQTFSVHNKYVAPPVMENLIKSIHKFGGSISSSKPVPEQVSPSSMHVLSFPAHDAWKKKLEGAPRVAAGVELCFQNILILLLVV